MKIKAHVCFDEDVEVEVSTEQFVAAIVCNPQWGPQGVAARCIEVLRGIPSAAIDGTNDITRSSIADALTGELTRWRSGPTRNL